MKTVHRKTLAQLPPAHAAAVLAIAQPHGPRYVLIEQAEWDRLAAEHRPGTAAALRPRPVSEWPVWAIAISKLRTDEDAGVGDTFKRLAAKFGGDVYKAFWASLGLPCGCNARQEDWNALYPYETRPPA